MLGLHILQAMTQKGTQPTVYNQVYNQDSVHVIYELQPTNQLTNLGAGGQSSPLQQLHAAAPNSWPSCWRRRGAVPPAAAVMPWPAARAVSAVLLRPALLQQQLPRLQPPLPWLLLPCVASVATGAAVLGWGARWAVHWHVCLGSVGWCLCCWLLLPASSSVPPCSLQEADWLTQHKAARAPHSQGLGQTVGQAWAS